MAKPSTQKKASSANSSSTPKSASSTSTQLKSTKAKSPASKTTSPSSKASKEKQETPSSLTPQPTVAGRKRARNEDRTAQSTQASKSKKLTPANESKAKDVTQASTEKDAEVKQDKVQEGVDDAVEEEEEEEEHDDASIIRGLSDVSGSDAGADSSDEDESDDDDDVAAGRHAPILATKLPSSKDEKSVRDRLERVKKAKKANKTAEVPAVLYVGRLPHGFYEKELRSYFSQFGEVTRLRLSRNKRTGAAKHYAFIEFADKDVATIVQETMDNYLIEGHLLQVRQVPKEKVHPKLWVGANRAYRKIPTDRRERVRREKTKTAEEQAATTERKLIKRQESKRSKLKSMGIDYEFQGYTK